MSVDALNQKTSCELREGEEGGREGEEGVREGEEGGREGG